MIQNIDLNLIPNGIPAKVYASQWDVQRKFTCTLYEGTAVYLLTDNTDVTINGRKNDDTVFIYTRDDGVLDWNVNTNKVTVTTALQISAAVGETECQLRFTDRSTGADLGSVNFTLEVSEMPGDDESAVSQTELPSIIAQAKAQEAACREYEALSRESAQIAVEAKNNALEAENRAATSAANARESEESAAESAEIARLAIQYPPKIGDNGNWWIYDSTRETYVDTGTDASISMEIEDITMLEPDENPRVENSGTSTDAVFHLFIPRTTSAYESAVAGGYEGTEAEFNDALGNFQDYAETSDTAAAVATQKAIDAEESAQRAEFYADFATPEFLIQDNKLYMKDDSAMEFTVANNRLYIKAA